MGSFVWVNVFDNLGATVRTAPRFRAPGLSDPVESGGAVRRPP